MNQAKSKTVDQPASHSFAHPTLAWTATEVLLLMMVFFIYAGDAAPMVNEAHYLVKAKNFWNPEWCQNDLFTSSAKAHTTYYITLGWLTKFASLETTAWVGRIVGWFVIAVGLQKLCAQVIGVPLLSLVVATVWIAGIEYGNLAGEWVVGGIEAKVPAYGFVLMAMAEMAKRNWKRVWPLLGIASAFHVLSGGWSVLAAMFVWMITERHRSDRVKLITPWLFLGGVISLLGLLPAIWLTIGVDPKDAVIAAKIYTYKRISHHLLPAQFPAEWYLRHGTLIGLILLGYSLLSSKQRQRTCTVQWFAVGAILIAALGLIIGILPQWNPNLAAKLLRYYWFRLTDAMVPLALGVLVASWLSSKCRYRFWIAVIAASLSVVLVGVSVSKRLELGIPPAASHRLLGIDVAASTEAQRKSYRDWISVCRWVRHATPPDEVFLTPRHQQSFKWYAHRAEVVNWKDVPQDAKSLKQWYARFDDIFPKWLQRSKVTINYATLRRYRKSYGVRFMIIDQRLRTGLPLVKVYPVGKESNDTYAVYELPSLE